jgi:hypothetical protein
MGNSHLRAMALKWESAQMGYTRFTSFPKQQKFQIFF